MMMEDRPMMWEETPDIGITGAVQTLKSQFEDALLEASLERRLERYIAVNTLIDDVVGQLAFEQLRASAILEQRDAGDMLAREVDAGRNAARRIEELEEENQALREEVAQARQPRQLVGDYGGGFGMRIRIDNGARRERKRREEAWREKYSDMEQLNSDLQKKITALEFKNLELEESLKEKEIEIERIHLNTKELTRYQQQKDTCICIPDTKKIIEKARNHLGEFEVTCTNMVESDRISSAVDSLKSALLDDNVEGYQGLARCVVKTMDTYYGKGWICFVGTMKRTSNGDYTYQNNSYLDCTVATLHMLLFKPTIAY